MDQATAQETRPWLAVGDEIASLLPHIDPNEFEAIRKEFADPSQRWFFSGQGRSGLSAQMVAMRIMHIGRESHVLGEVTSPSVREGDGIVFFSGSGETPVTLSFARIAQAEGARVVAVTKSANSSLAQLADAVLTIPAGPSHQLGGNLFEHSSLLVMDALVNVLGGELEDPHATLRHRHTNMQ